MAVSLCVRIQLKLPIHSGQCAEWQKREGKDSSKNMKGKTVKSINPTPQKTERTPAFQTPIYDFQCENKLVFKIHGHLHISIDESHKYNAQ